MGVNRSISSTDELNIRGNDDTSTGTHVSNRPVGVNKMKRKQYLSANAKTSEMSLSTVANEVTRGNDLFASSSIHFQDSADRLEDIKLLKMLDKDSEDYKMFMMQYMNDRAVRRKTRFRDDDDDVDNSVLSRK